MLPSEARLSARLGGANALNGPGPGTDDDHAEEHAWPIAYGVWGAAVTRNGITAEGAGYGQHQALARAYVNLTRKELQA